MTSERPCTDTFALQRLILAAALTPTERLVGLVLALSLDARSGRARISQAKLAELCGVTVRTVRRAVAILVASGLFVSQRTGRSSVLRAASPPEGGKRGGIVERTPVSALIGHQCPIGPHPWGLDTTYSTLAEERCKREARRRT